MNHSSTANDTVTDPVCGMTIDPATAVGSSGYNGDTYYFCSHACETKFDIAPSEYVCAPATKDQSGSCCSTAHSCC